MDNLSKIKKFSRVFYLFLTVMLFLIPLYFLFYWAFINHLPETLINVNMQAKPLVANQLSIKLQIIGFTASLFPLAALSYGLVNVRKLFTFYMAGNIFSFDHVLLFKKTAKALILWVIMSILYDSAKSILFSIGNPAGSRIVQVGLNSAEVTTLVVGGVIFCVAWIMDEGRILTEEQQLTV